MRSSTALPRNTCSRSIEGGLSYIRQRSPQHRAEETTYHHGLSDHIAYLEAPFHEAAEALHRRLHQFGIPH